MKKLFQVSALVAVFHFFLPFSSEGADAGVGLNNPTGATGEYNGSITTAGSYDPFTGNAKRMVDDLTVTGSIGAYPLKWTRIMNSRGGSGFRHNYSWGLSLRQPGPPHPCAPEVPDATISYPEGGKRILFKQPGPPPYYVQIDGWEPMGERLEEVGAHSYDLKLKDGGRVEFRGGMPTAIVDPYEQRTTLEYESGHLRKITEPGGRFLLISYTTFSYPNSANPPIPPLIYVDLITQVEAQDGRGNLMEKVVYTYTRVPSGGLLPVDYFMLTDVAYDGNDNPHAVYTYYPPGPITPGALMREVPGLLKTCKDVRYSGAMKNIEYLYLQHPTGEACGMSEGQIKEERNLSTHQAISKLIYPTGNECTYPYDSAPRFKRKEMRPDGAVREFQYNNDNAELESYTNFYYPGETPRTTTITYDNAAPDDHYNRIVTDALGHFTKTEKEQVVGAVMAVIHHDGSSVQYRYTDPANPYYLLEQTDERAKTTHYVRYPVGGPHANLIHWIYYPDGGSEEFTYNDFGQVVTHLMTSGGTEVFDYDTRGLKKAYTPPSTLSDSTPQTNPTRYYYYESGPHTDRLRYVVDPRGNATWYEYNGRGQVTKVTHQDTTFTQSDYNPDGTVAWTMDELGHTTQYEYDEYKRVTKTTNVDLGEIVKTSYDPNHENGADLSLRHTTPSIYRVTSPMLIKTDYDYDANFRRRWTIQASGTDDEAITKYLYDWVGNLLTVEDPRHKFTAYHYDERNRQDSVKNEELNETTLLHYDAASNKDRETRPDGFFRTWDYDEMNRLHHAYDWRMNETPRADQTTTYTRDHSGNATFITDTKGAVYAFVYDHLNRKESATNPSDATLPARPETWRYDIAGNLDTYTNPDEKRRHFHYDSRNRQDHSWWDGGLGIGQDIFIGYDNASRVTSITTMNDTTPITTVAFGYDAANRKVWEDQTLAGQPPRRVKTELDHDGKRMNLQITDPPTGRRIASVEMAGSGSYFVNYGYTKRNQLNTINGEGGAWAFNYVYDASGNMTTRQAQYNGRTSSTFCPPNETYDALNRPVTWSQTGPNGFYKSSHYQYDQANREKATWRDEDGNTGERFEYEASNQLKKVSYSMPALTPSPTPSATPTPPGGSPTPPNATPTPGQQVNEVTFNQTTGGSGNVLVTMSTTTANAVIFFTYSATGSPPDPTHTGSTAGSGTTRYVAPTSVANGTVRYFKALAYHEGMPDSNITEWLVDNGDGPNAVARTVTYQYTPDKLNRTSVTDGGVTTLYSPNALNQYTSMAGNSLSYDNNFNLTHTVGFNGIYDAGNLLVAASNGASLEVQQTIAGFVYDGLGRCVKRTFNGVGTILVYDGWKPIAEWEATVPGYFQAWNVYGPGPDEILLRQGGKYGYMRFHLDRHGNVAFLVDNDGVIQEKYTYDVFGKPKIMDAAGTQRPFSYYGHCFLFQGREYIRELGIYDYRHRFYNPELGNFIQVDPLGLQTEGAKLSAAQAALYSTGGAPETFSSSELNLYRYCNNDPVNRNDPFGLDPIVVSPGENELALKGDRQNLAAMNANTWFRLLSFEYSSTVFRDAQGVLTLSAPRTDYHTRDVRPPADPSKTSRVETHVHTFTARDDTTNSYLSAPDVHRGNQTGRPQEVISPNGVRDRYRPSDNAQERKRGEGGIIERLGKDDEWHRLSGANTDLNHPGAGRNGY